MKKRILTICLLTQWAWAVAQCLVGDCVNGEGSYQSVKSGWKYSGTFFNGKPHGKGKMLFPDGRYYEGEFSFGKYHGKGTMYLDAQAQISGIWRDGVCVSPDAPGKTTKSEQVVQKSAVKSKNIPVKHTLAPAKPSVCYNCKSRT